MEGNISYIDCLIIMLDNVVMYFADIKINDSSVNGMIFAMCQFKLERLA